MTLLQQGEDINLTLDAELQRYGEQLWLINGESVIEPKTGETLVTAPSYDPGILVGRQRSKITPYIYILLQNRFMMRFTAEYPWFSI
jgi:penicillin-binding protein 2